LEAAKLALGTIDAAECALILAVQGRAADQKLPLQSAFGVAG
jgi:hypothetical protein